MWYTFDLTFLSCSLLSGGEQRLAHEVLHRIHSYSKPMTHLLSDADIDEKGVYIFHNYADIHYVGKTSRTFRQRVGERKSSASASDRRVWALIDKNIDFYVLIPTSFSTQLEAILLHQGIKGRHQKREVVALRDFQHQRHLVLETLSIGLSWPISAAKGLWRWIETFPPIRSIFE